MTNDLRTIIFKSVLFYDVLLSYTVEDRRIIYSKRICSGDSITVMMTSKISLAEYGPPPELPSVDDIMEDLGKASFNDIVFKSSAAASTSSDIAEESSLLTLEKDSCIEIPAEDNRNDLTPKLAYEISLKLQEKQKASVSLLKSLDNHNESLNSLKGEIMKHLERLNKQEE